MKTAPDRTLPINFNKKKILLALTGSIAAYKSVELLRYLTTHSADVQVLMTEGACTFVQPLTLSALSSKPILRHLHEPSHGSWNNHIHLAMWADLIVVAPLSAHTLAKMAYGLCDNLLLSVYLSAKSPVLLAPAMDEDMYLHASTQQNLQILRNRGHEILDVEEGFLASGLQGKGRMAEPLAIGKKIAEIFTYQNRFSKKRVLITAGPTHEKIDPVRFISNASSGKMGISMAKAFVMQGATVHLVLGPTSETFMHPSLSIHKVQDAQEMYKKTKILHETCDIIIFAAAVADYRPSQPSLQKIKKKHDTNLCITLTKNKDLAALLGKKKKRHQLHVGFALETHNEKQNALEKLKTKNFDLLILNSLQEEGVGFYHDTNKVSFFYKDGRIEHFNLKLKSEVALDILNGIYTTYMS